MSRSNLADAIATIDRCSEDELRQIQALIAVRLGSAPPKKLGGRKGKQTDGGKKGSKASPGGKSSVKGSGVPLKKGNPQRKSQYATHPVYQAYKTAQQAVDAEAKKQKLSFSALTGPARAAYEEALSNWLQTKSGFRRSEKIDENSDSQSEKQKVEKAGGERAESQLVPRQPSVDSSHEGSTEVPPNRSRKRNRKSKGSESPSPGKYYEPPDGWDGSPEEWVFLHRNERRRIWQEASKMDVSSNGEGG